MVPKMAHSQRLQIHYALAGDTEHSQQLTDKYYYVNDLEDIATHKIILALLPRNFKSDLQNKT